MVTLIQAAFGVCGKQQPFLLVFMPRPWAVHRSSLPTEQGGSLGWLRLPGAALHPELQGKGLSQARRSCMIKKGFWGKER